MLQFWLLSDDKCNKCTFTRNRCGYYNLISFQLAWPAFMLWKPYFAAARSLAMMLCGTESVCKLRTGNIHLYCRITIIYLFLKNLTLLNFAKFTLLKLLNNNLQLNNYFVYYKVCKVFFVKLCKRDSFNEIIHSVANLGRRNADCTCIGFWIPGNGFNT